MRIDFLGADTPLTKTFSRTADALEVTPYPLVKRVTSESVNVDNLRAWYTALRTYSARGWCMLKGQLTKPLNDESRAGCTSRTDQTTWLHLDLDFDDGFASIDELLTAIDPAFANVSYIYQRSASVGIKSAIDGLRGHVFIQLNRPYAPGYLKIWLQDRNLVVSALRHRIGLSANAMALTWPLDITGCQNDRLIYIANPVCEGFDDPLPDRIILVEKTHAAASLTVTAVPEAVREGIQERLDELRTQAGLSRRKQQIAFKAGMEVIENPGNIVVTSEVRDCGHYWRFNLNGGDSWAYVIYKDQPEFVQNFKGEPVMRTRHVLPQVYSEITGMQNTLQTAWTFHNLTDDSYYAALYQRDVEQVDYFKLGSRERLNNFRAKHNLGILGRDDPVEVWTLEFAPQEVDQVDFERKWVNAFTPTQFMRTPGECTEVPPHIAMLLRHVTGSDEPTYQHFLHWLAFVFQQRDKAGTGWLLYGVPGTGKGLTYSRIIKPLFGENYCPEIQQRAFNNEFNRFMEHALIVTVDEVHVDDAETTQIIDTLKHLITEPTIQIRAMRSDHRAARNYANFLFFSNHEAPLPIHPGERRLNVAPYQRKAFRPPPGFLDALTNELQDFAGFLHNYPVEDNLVRWPLENLGRAQLMQSSRSSVDQFFDAVRAGDLDFLASGLRATPPRFDSPERVEYQTYIDVLKRLAASSGPRNIPSEDLRALYKYLTGAGATTPLKFARICATHMVEVKQRWIDGKNLRGVCIDLQCDDELRRAINEAGNPVGMQPQAANDTPPPRDAEDSLDARLARLRDRNLRPEDV